MTDMATDRANQVDLADHGGHENRVNRCDDPGARPSSPPCGPVVLPASPGVSDASEVPTCVGWLLRFQVVTLVVAAILCGLATVALLVLSWSFFALSALLAPNGLCIHLTALAVARAA